MSPPANDLVALAGTLRAQAKARGAIVLDGSVLPTPNEPASVLRLRFRQAPT